MERDVLSEQPRRTRRRPTHKGSGEVLEFVHAVDPHPRSRQSVTKRTTKIHEVDSVHKVDRLSVALRYCKLLEATGYDAQQALEHWRLRLAERAGPGKILHLSSLNREIFPH